MEAQTRDMVQDALKLRPRWTIRRYADDKAFRKGEAYSISHFDGNLLLNEGITELIDLLIGAAATAYSNGNAYIGVGDDDTAASASQTGLQAIANKTYKGMEGGYPTNSSQAVTFRAVFGSSDANYAWKEFTVVNANSDTGDNLNRKVSDQGTKASGQTWTVDLEITFS